MSWLLYLPFKGIFNLLTRDFTLFHSHTRVTSLVCMCVYLWLPLLSIVQEMGNLYQRNFHHFSLSMFKHQLKRKCLYMEFKMLLGSHLLQFIYPLKCIFDISTLSYGKVLKLAGLSHFWADFGPLKNVFSFLKGKRQQVEYDVVFTLIERSEPQEQLLKIWCKSEHSMPGNKDPLFLLKELLLCGRKMKHLFPRKTSKVSARPNEYRRVREASR